MKNQNKIQRNIIITIAIVAIVIIGYYVYGRDSNSDEIITDEEILVKEAQEEKVEDKIKVHIMGAVQNEGIITLDENARVSDAVEAAGGLKEDADLNKINLAYILEDGMKIKIPSISDKEETDENEEKEIENDEIIQVIPESSTKSTTSKININKAGQTELEMLPGIGPTIALKIVNYRNENGKFASIDGLKEVSGIGESKFEKIKDLVSIK